MQILDINSLGGTCDRCGKALVNVAVISDELGKHTVGLDCLQKVEVSDFETKQQIRTAVKEAKALGSIKRLALKGELITKFEVNPNGEKIYYWKGSNQYKWNWIGLECQNTKGLSREIWAIVAK